MPRTLLEEGKLFVVNYETNVYNTGFGQFSMSVKTDNLSLQSHRSML